MLLAWLVACRMPPAAEPVPVGDTADTAACTACTDWYADDDGDGWGQDALRACACAGSPAYPVARGGDCDDRDAGIHPEADERCGDFADNDCDGVEDGAGAVDCAAGWVDADGDGFGADPLGCVCAGAGVAVVAGDCDDGDAATFPGAAEAEGGACRRDADDDGYGAAAVAAPVEAGADCDDADASRFPAAPATCNDGVDQACDGGLGCRLVGAELPADAELARTVDGERHGEALAACDLEGDGVDEVLVGGPHGRDDGGAWLLRVGADGAWAPWEALGPTGDAAGTAVACADLDADGAPDLVIGAPGAGSVAVIPAGDALRAWSVAGEPPGSLGTALAVLGDLDGDGRAELAVGDHLQARVDWVDVDTRALRDGPAGDAGSYFGRALGAPGDVDGDGLDELIVGAYGADDGAGAATLFLGAHGRATGRAADGQATWTGPARAYAGTVVAGGDLDADGYADVVVGSNLGSAVWIVRGSASPAGGPLDAMDARLSGSLYQMSLAVGGDVDGDGFADVLVGSWDFDTGVAWWVPGAATLPSGELIHAGVALRSTDPDFEIGRAVAFAQLDGEAGADLVVSAASTSESAVYAVFGRGR